MPEDIAGSRDQDQRRSYGWNRPSIGILSSRLKKGKELHGAEERREGNIEKGTLRLRLKSGQ